MTSGTISTSARSDSYVVIDSVSFHPSSVPDLAAEIREVRERLTRIESRLVSPEVEAHQLPKTPVVNVLEELLREQRSKSTPAARAASEVLESLINEKTHREHAEIPPVTPELKTSFERVAQATAVALPQGLNFAGNVFNQIKSSISEGIEGLQAFLKKPSDEKRQISQQLVDEHLKEMLTPRTFNKAAAVLVGMEVGESICGFIFGAMGGKAVGQVVGSVVGSVLFEYLAIALDLPTKEGEEPSLKEYGRGFKKLGDIDNTIKRVQDFPRWAGEYFKNLKPEETSSWLLHLAGHKFFADVPGIMAGWAIGTALGLPPGGTAALSCLGNWISSFLFHWMVEGHEAWAIKRRKE